MITGGQISIKKLKFRNFKYLKTYNYWNDDDSELHKPEENNDEEESNIINHYQSQDHHYHQHNHCNDNLD